MKFDSVPVDTIMEHLDGIHEGLEELWKEATAAQIKRQPAAK